MSPKRCPTFNVSRNGKPIVEVRLKSHINTGIVFGQFQGIVHPWYEIAACNAANYRYFHDWQELSGEQKAVLVSHHLTDILVENHKQDAANEEMERASRKAKRKK